MAKLAWDSIGQRFYETGVDHGVLYLLDKTADTAAGETPYTNGVVWNGLTSVSESPSGAESNPQYADNIKYLNLISAEEFAATIEAFTYPKEFKRCDGTADLVPGVSIGQQNHEMFGFSYRTKVGNDIEGQDHGYKLHLIYGCQAAPSQKQYNTINESPEAMTFSWELSTTPVAVLNHKPTATVTVDSTLVDPGKMKALEDILYGTDTAPARLPLPDEVATIIGTV